MAPRNCVAPFLRNTCCITEGVEKILRKGLGADGKEPNPKDRKGDANGYACWRQRGQVQVGTGSGRLRQLCELSYAPLAIRAVQFFLFLCDPSRQGLQAAPGNDQKSSVGQHKQAVELAHFPG